MVIVAGQITVNVTVLYDDDPPSVLIVYVAVNVPAAVVGNKIYRQFWDVAGAKHPVYVTEAPEAENDEMGQLKLSEVVKVLGISNVYVPVFK